MKIGKGKMFLLFNGLIAAGLFIYFAIWIFGGTVNGKVVRPFDSDRVNVQYTVNNKTYTGNYMRNGLEFRTQFVTIRYFPLAPSMSRINSFVGIYAEPLGWWLIFFIASAMLLLTDNAVFSKGTMFRIEKKFPWISMEEYFRLPWYYNETNTDETPQPKHKQVKQLGTDS